MFPLLAAAGLSKDRALETKAMLRRMGRLELLNDVFLYMVYLAFMLCCV